jgi:hypothetical protein
MAGNPRIGLFRANAFARPVASFLFAATNRLIGNAEDPTVGTTPFTALNSYSAPGLAAQVEDIIIAYNDLRFLRGRAWGLSQISGAIAGTPNASLRRQVMIGNIVERIGDTAEPFYAFGEDTSATMTYNIIEANSFVGDRANTFYSDPLPATLAAVDTQRNQALVNRVANNCFDWLPTKHDDFNDPTAAQRRGTANGYRPQMVEAWSMLYGVGHEGNVDHNRVSGGNFPLEFSGLRSRNGYAGQLNPQFASDRSIEGPDGLAAPGGGDYTPAATAPAAGRGLRGNSDVDAVGRLRTLPFTAGALQVAAIDLLAQPAQSGHSVTAPALALVPAAPLAPAGARSGTLAGAATLGWLAGLDPAAAVCGTRAGAAVLDWRADLVPVASALDSAASATGLMLTLALLPGSAILLTGAAGSEIEAMSRFLHPDPALLATGAAAARLTLPPGTPVATIIIGADPRTLTPFRP